MPLFRFKADLTLSAQNPEQLLSLLAGHLADCSRHLGNERSLSDVCKHFTVEEAPADSKADELVDHALEEHGTIELTCAPVMLRGPLASPAMFGPVFKFL